jgi:predicted porin
MKDLILELHITATVSQKQIKYDGDFGGLTVLVQWVFVVRSRMNPSVYANSVAQYDHELYCPEVY